MAWGEEFGRTWQRILASASGHPEVDLLRILIDSSFSRVKSLDSVLMFLTLEIFVHMSCEKPVFMTQVMSWPIPGYKYAFNLGSLES